jgi:predicted Zn-dependent protease
MRIFLPVLTALAITSCSQITIAWDTPPPKTVQPKERSETDIGRLQYRPMLQMQGGTFDRYGEINHYVEKVGRRLVERTDRTNLPFEFEIINASVPNAWSLPGGKIAVTRGLLHVMKSEAEFASILAHEIAHVVLRHRTHRLSQGLQLDVTVGMMRSSAQEHTYADLMLEQTALGVTLLTAPYTATDEDEADALALKLLSDSGYDPRLSAVAMQRLYDLAAHDPDLFDMHPPTTKRIADLAIKAETYSVGGRIGSDIYERQLVVLEKTAPAYLKLDTGYRALVEGNADKALMIAEEGLAIDRQGAQLWGLKGKALAKIGRAQEAIDAFTQALTLNDSHFDFFLQRGNVFYKTRRVEPARRDLLAANRLLPTAGAHYALADMDEQDGLYDQALEHYNVAATNSLGLGTRSKISASRISLPRDPEKYLRTQLTLDEEGYLRMTTTNYSHVPVRELELGVRINDTESLFFYRKKDRRSVLISKALLPGESHVQPTRIGPFISEELMREQVHTYIISTKVE